jgi:dynein intermediate chain
MDIDWSIKYPELFLGAYNKNLASEHDPDGLVCVWNTHLTDRAEFIFHAPSDVLTAKFSPFHPNYIVGGTYTGQILLWDTRSKRLPVLKSPLNSTGHTHPVYNLSMIGTHNAHNCITASSDGMICAWQLDLLAQPQEVLELLHPSPLRADDLGITALDFPTNETATFWVGTEEGAVYQINRYDRAGIKVGVHPNDIYSGHSGPITSLHFHPQVGALDFSDLFLTTSFDWTVKLWQAKSLTRPSPTPTQIAPLASFEHGSDYILDAQWSPSHPGAFGSVDAGGNFSVWNLNHDLEIPTSTLNLTSRGLNKIKWDKDGSKAAIGASDGKIYVCEVPSLSNPHSEDGAIFQKTVSSLTRNVFNKD